jgi:Flp pilus assembly protein TadD
MPPLRESIALDPALPPVHEQVEIPGVTGLHPIVSDAVSTLAWSHIQSGGYQEALRLFREVTQRHPEWADPLSGLGWTLARLGDRQGAEDAFRRSLQTNPRHPDAMVGLRMLGKKP